MLASLSIAIVIARICFIKSFHDLEFDESNGASGAVAVKKECGRE